MIKLLALLAAVLAAAAAVQGTGASFTASSTNNGSSFATAAKFAPSVAVTAPADGSATNDTTPTITGTAGAATGDGTWSVNASPLAQGTYTVQATQTDTAGNTGTSNANTFKVDTAKPTAVRLVAANGGGGTAGKLNAGDTVTFTYSEAISPASVLTGWDGSSTAVQIRFTNASTDSFSILSTNLGSVATNGNYVTGTTTFSATMTRSTDGASIVITLGTPSNVASAPVSAKDMTWTFTAAVKDLAGNTITAGSWTESDGDVDF